jgi:O-antigen ligase
LTLYSLLIFLLLLAPTIQYRIELGPFSLAFMEPVTLLVALVLIGDQIRRRGSLFLPRDPLIPLILVMCVWAFMFRPLGLSWTRGLSDARDWIVPAIGYIALVASVRQGWRRWITILLVGVILQALFGVYQHLSDSARPFVNTLASYKTGFAISAEAVELVFVSYAVGLFTHPNGFAIYLFGGFMLLLSWPAAGLRLAVKAIFIALIGGCLFWTYAKASLLVMTIAVAWYIIQRRLRADQVLMVTAIGLVVGVGLVFVALRVVPETLLTTFYWRVGLWEFGVDTAFNYPQILLFGSGLERFSAVAYYGQPHSVYVYLLLEYGLFGLVWFVAIMGVIAHRGWQARMNGLFRREPRLAGLWVYLLGFAIVGIVESNLQGIESRALFLSFYACFSGLRREVQAEQTVASADSEAVVSVGSDRLRIAPL